MNPINDQEQFVEVRNLYKNYGETTALNNVSFSLNRGEILGILGPNGAGKSTSIHIILGLLTPSAGEVSVLGLSPIKNRHLLSKKINFSSAYSQLPSNLKVIENLKTYARIYQIKNPKEKINELLETFEITHLYHRLTGALSSGEKTRVNLAKSFINDPVLLVLDEPTASLDPDMSDKVRNILKKIQTERNLGILYTSHNMFEVEALCNRIIFIHKGNIITEGPPEKIRTLFESPSLEQAFIKIVRDGKLISGDDSNEFRL